MYAVNLPLVFRNTTMLHKLRESSKKLSHFLREDASSVFL